MFTRNLFLSALAACSLWSAPPPRPKLVVFIVVDQFRYDYLTKYRADYKDGFDTLLKHGANFTNANDDFFPTLTATSHATLLTGAMASSTGIVGNEWFDRDLGKHVMSVSDDSAHLVGTDKGEGLSPHYLLTESLGDVLKQRRPGARVIAISMKDRSAMLLGGKHPNAAYWFDIPSGQFVTSSWYMSQLPEWVGALNARHPADRYLGQEWAGHAITKNATGYRVFERSPYGDELAEAFAEAAIEAEHLGKGRQTDILALSFPSTDYAGHDYGPGTPESRETLVRMDRTLGKLFRALDLSRTLVVLTSDHGIPLMDADNGKSPLTAVSDSVQAALAEKYGAGKWVAGCWDLLLYLNTDLIAEKKLDRAEVNRAAARAVLSVPHIARAYTREQLRAAKTSTDETLRRMVDGFHAERGADIEFLPEENWVFTSLKTTHGSTYSYDTHVPLLFMGRGIAAGSHLEPVRSNDIAPTLAKILGLPAPAASVGRAIPALY